MLAFGALGVCLGAAGAYSSGRGAALRASLVAEAPPLREPQSPAELRDDHVRRLLAGDASAERLPAPAGWRPKIILIFDDMGLDRRSFDAVMALPGPVTLSFLPYGDGSAEFAREARAAGRGIMLHLPMEPDGRDDPGPHALRHGMSAVDLLAALDWNLSRIDGYVAVNNHMGSRATRDDAMMRTVLSVLRDRSVAFVDSKTSPRSVALRAGRAVGADVYARDVFLDPASGPETVRTQLRLLERIARSTGYAVAIAHPHQETLGVLGPWLTSAPSRGFELATVEALPELQRLWRSDARYAMRAAPPTR